MTFAQAQEKIKELASKGQTAHTICLHYAESYEYDVRAGHDPRAWAEPDKESKDKARSWRKQRLAE